MEETREIAINRLQAAYDKNNIPPLAPEVIKGLKTFQIVKLAEEWERCYSDAHVSVDLSTLFCQDNRGRVSYGRHSVDGKFNPAIRGYGAILLRDDGGTWA